MNWGFSSYLRIRDRQMWTMVDSHTDKVPDDVVHYLHEISNLSTFMVFRIVFTSPIHLHHPCCTQVRINQGYA